MSAVELVENQRDWLIRQNINMNPTRIELELTEQCNLKCLSEADCFGNSLGDNRPIA